MLARWGASKRHGMFACTSNIDGHWRRTIDPGKVYECHGSLTHFQHVDPHDDDTLSGTGAAVWAAGPESFAGLDVQAFVVAPGERLEVLPGVTETVSSDEDADTDEDVDLDGDGEDSSTNCHAGGGGGGKRRRLSQAGPGPADVDGSGWLPATVAADGTVEIVSGSTGGVVDGPLRAVRRPGGHDLFRVNAGCSLPVHPATGVRAR